MPLLLSLLLMNINLNNMICTKPYCQICNPEPWTWNWFKVCFVDFIEFVRWYELFFLLFTLFLGYSFLGWWGVILALLLNKLNHLEGGPMSDMRGEYREPVRLPCSENLKNCRVCGNGYSHDFNVRTLKNLKWYEKII